MSHRSAVAARIVLVALLAISMVFIATDGFGLFDHHVDVLLIGDSIMSQSGPFVAERLDAQPGVGAASVHVAATPGTGLLTPALMDWQTRAADLVERYRPRIVVLLFVGNYTDDPNEQWIDAAGQRVPNDYGPAFWAAWKGQTEKLVKTVGRFGAQVDLVLPPPLIGAEGRRREQGGRAVYEAVQRETVQPNKRPIGLIDARIALGGPDGEFVWERPNVDGVVVPVRVPDSVHLTDDGGRLLARQMVDTLAPQILADRRHESRP